MMFPPPSTDFDYSRTPSSRRRGCQSASVLVGQDHSESGCLADTSALHKRRCYPPRSPLFTPAGFYILITNDPRENLLSCHKLWLSKADFTWLIIISHKGMLVLHYDVIWLIAFTWLRTCESLVDYDWLIVSWRHDCDFIWCNDFAHDSDYESWVSRMRLIREHHRVYGYGSRKEKGAQLICKNQLMDFAPWLIMSHGGYVRNGDVSPGLGLCEDAYIRRLVSTKR